MIGRGVFEFILFCLCLFLEINFDYNVCRNFNGDVEYLIVV